jgi:hypothetical protein
VRKSSRQAAKAKEALLEVLEDRATAHKEVAVRVAIKQEASDEGSQHATTYW